MLYRLACVLSLPMLLMITAGCDSKEESTATESNAASVSSEAGTGDGTAEADHADATAEPDGVTATGTGGETEPGPDSAGKPSPESDATTASGPIRLFDGETLEGWEGNTEIFRIENGAIVGGTLDEKVAHNEFLTTRDEFADFELRLKFMLKGENTNAGVQIRSRRIDNPPHEMIGYQADLGQSYWGCLYDESRRRKVLAGPDKAELEKVLKRDDWNEYRIRCEGRRIQLWINGLQTVDYTEEDDSIEQTGLIGLQIHGGPPGEAWYRDIVLEKL